MKLAFSGEGRYTDFDDAYRLYVSRSKTGQCMDEATYHRVIRLYCKRLAERLCENGIADLPSNMGSIAAATITRKARYRDGKFQGYGKWDWNTKTYDGKLKTFGMVYLPRQDKNNNLRCFGFVANRRLFKKMKAIYESGECPWYPIDFRDEMI